MIVAVAVLVLEILEIFGFFVADDDDDDDVVGAGRFFVLAVFFFLVSPSPSMVCGFGSASVGSKKT